MLHSILKASRLQNQAPTCAMDARNTQTFPISRVDIENLEKQIKSVSRLKLDLNDFLSLVKSTILHARQAVLQLRSISDVNSILDETNTASDLVFSQIGQHIPRFRFALRLEYFKQVVGKGHQFEVETFYLLQNHQGFPGHKQLQQELIRGQIEAHLQLEYNLPPCREVQRISRQHISSLSKAEYAQHCLNLLNLGMPMSSETFEKMSRLCFGTNIPRQLIRSVKDAYDDNAPVHVHIANLLRADLNLPGNHNTHLASRLLELSTGFVFHANSSTNIPQLLNSNSPSAFQNVGALLTEKYLAAFNHNNTRHFFENAFIQHDPCYEATIENLLEFKPEQLTDLLSIPPTPKWTPLASTEENISAMLDWQEIALLKNYADLNNIFLKADDHRKIDQLLGCAEFHNFIHDKKRGLLDRIASLIPVGTPHHLSKQFDAKWPK